MHALSLLENPHAGEDVVGYCGVEGGVGGEDVIAGSTVAGAEVGDGVAGVARGRNITLSIRQDLHELMINEEAILAISCFAQESCCCERLQILACSGVVNVENRPEFYWREHREGEHRIHEIRGVQLPMVAFQCCLARRTKLHHLQKERIRCGGLFAESAEHELYKWPPRIIGGHCAQKIVVLGTMRVDEAANEQHRK